MRGSNLLFIASWLILLVLSAAIFLFAAESLWIAYTAKPDGLTREYTITQIGEQGGDEAVKAFRGRRATAATFALGYALLAMAVTWIPYRRGEKWAWWALLVSLGLSQFLSLARAVALGTTGGVGAPAVLLAFVLLGLLSGVPRLFSSGPPRP
jgi:hypothetical protein